MFQIEGEPRQGFEWKDKYGNDIDIEDKVKKLGIRTPIEVRQFRYPETDEDFKTIFDREFSKHPELIDRNIFKAWHVKEIESKLKNYQGETPEETDPKLFEIIRKYLDYLKSNEDRIKQWNPLFYELHNYVSCMPETFGYVMENHRLPKGEEKIKWNTYKSDAMYFAVKFNFEVSVFDKCFIHKDGKQFKDNNKTQTTPKEPLPTIIERYL
ncbi:MAG: hypothetical protein K0B37_15130 [Bacteroidales bacterium]|nr:hypothetical protein [Bacteroidales bacterium]